MITRYLKVVFVAIIALMCLVYAGQNVANSGAAYQAFLYVMSGADHTVYPSSFGPLISNPVLVWAALIVVVGFEFFAGLLAAKGAVDMWLARNASAEVFTQAKKYALLGCGMGIVVWAGFFGVGGGAYFQMWQTQIGAGSLADAFKFFASCGIVFIIVSMADE